MTKLSVNINKFATLRNARGGKRPDIVQTAKDCERFGAEGITVHPRPDERHIRYDDVVALKDCITTEFNIEGYPNKRYLEMIAMAHPTQSTLVPDPPDVLTSNAGWDTVKNQDFLKEILMELKSYGARTSIFVDPDIAMVEGAARCGADRIELYTESYARHYLHNKEKAIAPFAEAAKVAKAAGLEINAGHDLDLNNLNYMVNIIPEINEVSIGHAIICDAIYLGLENTIQLYLRQLKK